MKLMNRKLLVCLLCAATLWGAVACTDDEGQDTAAETTHADTDTAEVTEPADITEAETPAETETAPLPADFEVTVEGAAAHVLTPTGLSYTVTGYTAIEQAAVTFTEGLTVTFSEDVLAESFNRFSMTYESTAYLRVYVTYVADGQELEADYYLEAGNGTFSGLVPDFLDGQQGKRLTTLRVDTCEGCSATFTLAGLTTELTEVPKSTLHIENDAFKLGIDLSWGGTINYLKDKNCPVRSLINLVNRYDTGRLIQQSFYGTAGVEGEYEPGIYGDWQWVYNPVQGGDQYNNASRLIDLVIGDNYVYIKCQPGDWSLNGVLTPSYMENTYTLEADYIRVDNRFTDFSGWEHPYSSQELPALYTVSYLDTFVWYDGESSWTGDALSSRSDLPFWGDEAYSADCMFVFREKNTETWCAWINGEKDYGLGIYVPNVDQLKAGRFQYDGSMSATAVSCSYVAPVSVLKLEAFHPLSYSYLLTTGSTSEIRDTFAQYKDFSDNASLSENHQSTRLPSVEGDITKLDFTTPANLALLKNPVNTVIAHDSAEQAVKLTSGALGDSNVTILYSSSYEALIAENYTTLRIEYMIPTTNSTSRYQSDVFLCTGALSEPSGDARVRVDLIADGTYHTLEIDLSSRAFWSGEIHKIRFDYFDASADGDVMYVRSITLE